MISSYICFFRDFTTESYTCLTHLRVRQLPCEKQFVNNRFQYECISFLCNFNLEYDENVIPHLSHFHFIVLYCSKVLYVLPSVSMYEFVLGFQAMLRRLIFFLSLVCFSTYFTEFDGNYHNENNSRICESK